MRRVAATLAVSLIGLGGALTSAATAEPPNSCTATRVNSPQGTWRSDEISSASDVDWYRFTTTSSQYALITLGGLTGDLTLALYDGSCHLVASSQHAGTRFEDIFRSLPAGRYEVRVGGASGATGAYDLKFRSLNPGTHLLDSRAFTDENGQLAIVGQVVNNRSSYWYLRYVIATYYDRFGHVLGHEDGNFPIQVAKPRARLPFEVSGRRPAGYDHYALQLITEPTTSYIDTSPSKALVEPSPSWIGSQGTRHYPGGVHNSGSTQLLLGRVVYWFFDSHARVLRLAQAPVVPSTLPAHADGGYDVTLSDAAGVTAYAYALPTD